MAHSADEEAMNEVLTPRDEIARLMDGYIDTQLVYVAARLGIADLLRDGPRSSAELAALTGTVPSTLHRLLRGLVVNGVLDEDTTGRFIVTPAGRCLDSDAADSLRGAVMTRGELYYEAAGALIQTIRQGGAAFHHAHGRSFFEVVAAHPEGTALFQASMVARSQHEARTVVQAYDFSSFGRIVDVGGGHGVLLTEILKAHSNVRGILFDRPDVIAGARNSIEAAGIACELAPGDFFAGVPAGGDVYLLSRVIHDWDDAEAIQILRSCRQAMADDAVLLVVEAVLPERARDLPAAIRMDLHMLTLFNGRERTLTEFEQLFAASRFDLRRAIPTGDRTGITVLEAHAIDVASGTRQGA
jgi:hypothetical protein